VTCAFGPWQLLHARIDRSGWGVVQVSSGELDVGFVLHLSVHMGRLYVRGCWFFFFLKVHFTLSKYRKSFIFNMQLKFWTLGAIQLSTPSKSGTSGGFPFCGSLKIPI